MIGYDEFTAYAPPASSREERDAWFAEHGVDVTALMQVGREVAVHRLSNLEDGDSLGTKELVLLLVSVFLFGYEMGTRVALDEKPDIYGRNGDEPA